MTNQKMLVLALTDVEGELILVPFNKIISIVAFNNYTNIMLGGKNWVHVKDSVTEIFEYLERSGQVQFSE